MMNGLFNVKRHSDVVVEVFGAPEGTEAGQSQSFHLHKFPLIAASGFFADYFEKLDAAHADDDVLAAASGAGGGAGGGGTPAATPQVFVKLDDFPGGPPVFEALARHCYGESPVVTVKNVAHMFCGARLLRLVEISRQTETFMQEEVLTSAANATAVLAAATGITGQPDAVMVDLVGRCINTVASSFVVVPELQALPPDCFACVLRTAKDTGQPKKLLEEAVVAFCTARIDPSPAPSKFTPAQFHEVVAAPGAMDDMLHADAVYRLLEVFVGELNDVGLWRCLPHAAIEAAYANRAVPDRCVTVALMSENRHLLKLNDELADQVEELSDALRAHGLPLPASLAGEPPKQLLDGAV